MPSASIPIPHQHFLKRVYQLRIDGRIVGVAAGGSFITSSLDEFSDLDLVVVVEPGAYLDVLRDRHSLVSSLGELLTCYTGEHLGEPRLMVCLYDQPLLLVDINFVSFDDVSGRTEDPVVIWDRSDRLGQALRRSESRFPAPDHQWIEARFWVWVYFTALKIARGELFEAINFLAFLRSKVLGPLALERANCRPIGLRRIEKSVPEFAEQLRNTLARHDSMECVSALRATAELYRTLRSTELIRPTKPSAESAAMEYLSALERRVGRAG